MSSRNYSHLNEDIHNVIIRPNYGTIVVPEVDSRENSEFSSHENTPINEDTYHVTTVRPNYDTIVQSEDDQSEHSNTLFCNKCTSKLCHKCKMILHQLKNKEEECERLYRLNAFYLGLYRLPALFVTLLLEMIGGILIDGLNNSITEFVLLASFMPVISALSGNLGLQASSNTTRGLATGNIPIQSAVRNIWKEVRSGVIASLTISTVLALVAGIWTQFDSKDIKEIDHREMNHLYPLYFALIIFAGTFLSMMVSTVNGALMPILAHKCNLDPAKVAGPLETAFQDIIGQAFLLGFASAILIPMFHSHSPTTFSPPTSVSQELTSTFGKI